MRYAFAAAAVLGLAVAAPRPQEINLDEVDSAPAPTVLGPAIAAVSDVVSYNPTSAASSVAAAITDDPITARKRSVMEQKRDGTCASQPVGYTYRTTNPDTPAGFLADSTYSSASTGANAPSNYSPAPNFVNLQGSLSQIGYLGLYTLTSYDPSLCKAKCDANKFCMGFDIYFERDPSLDPNTQNCPNPQSITNVKCTLYGYPVSGASATNKGQYRDSFQVVITGSNGYNKFLTPAPQTNFTGPVALPAAINAPLNSNGQNTYVGMKIFTSGPYDPSLCAAACQAQTAYDKATAASDGSYMPCNFFNSYILSKNTVPQGTYCSFYSQVWDSSYATNTGQNRGSDVYTVSESFAYTLTNPDSGSTLTTRS